MWDARQRIDEIYRGVRMYVRTYVRVCTYVRASARVSRERFMGKEFRSINETLRMCDAISPIRGQIDAVFMLIPLRVVDVTAGGVW